MLSRPLIGIADYWADAQLDSLTLHILQCCLGHVVGMIASNSLRANPATFTESLPLGLGAPVDVPSKRDSCFSCAVEVGRRSSAQRSGVCHRRRQSSFWEEREGKPTAAGGRGKRWGKWDRQAVIVRDGSGDDVSSESCCLSCLFPPCCPPDNLGCQQRWRGGGGWQ